jgi:hypothetical protein
MLSISELQKYYFRKTSGKRACRGKVDQLNNPTVNNALVEGRTGSAVSKNLNIVVSGISENRCPLRSCAADCGSGPPLALGRIAAWHVYIA